MRVSKAIFLVAGTSSRFRGVVDHKALLKLHGQTLLERQIVQATNLGITHFVFAIGAAPESIIKETIRVFYHYGIPYLQATFINCHRYRTTNNAQTLYECKKELQGGCFIFECDVAAELPQHLPNNSLWFVVKEYMGDGSFVRVGTSGYIEENTIIRKSRLGELDETWQKSAGIFMLMPEDAHKLIAQLYSPPDPSAYIDQILPLGNMQTFPLEPWWEIDTVEDFEKAKQLIKTPVRLLPPDPILL